MERTRQHQTTPPAGYQSVGRQTRRMLSDGNASVAELREFLSRMQGKSPQEVLGLVSESDLLKSTIVATVGFAILLFAFTAGPYAWAKMGGDEPKAAVTTAPTQPNETAEADEPTTPPVAQTGESNAQPSDAERAVEAMGIGEATESAADQNPLDNKLDKLLDIDD